MTLDDRGRRRDGNGTDAGTGVIALSERRRARRAANLPVPREHPCSSARPPDADSAPERLARLMQELTGLREAISATLGEIAGSTPHSLREYAFRITADRIDGEFDKILVQLEALTGAPPPAAPSPA